MRRHWINAAAVVVLAAGWTGCRLGPDYRRPAPDYAPQLRAAGEGIPADLAAAPSLGDLDWPGVFRDAHLADLIRQALTNSPDTAAAAARVLQAQASVGIARSGLFPQLGLGAEGVAARGSEIGASPVPPGTDTSVEYAGAAASVPFYELDLWGRLRRATEAARARLLSAEESRRIVRQTLVAETARAYFELQELDVELAIAERAIVNRRESLQLTTVREEGGVASLQDVYQADVLLTSAEATRWDLKRRIEQKENEISLLAGRAPGPVERSPATDADPLGDTVPAGLPSALLARRPDVRSAEHALRAANADIGQARAAFFPQIGLTGTFGVQSSELGDLFTNPARLWQFGPSLSVPLFTGGRLTANLRLAEAKFDEAVALYRKAVQSSFRDASDALVGAQRSRGTRERLEKNTAARRDAARLAKVRYEGGVTSYLEVLYNENELFNAEIALAQARRNEHLALVQLYRALGGGWRAEN